MSDRFGDYRLLWRQTLLRLLLTYLAPLVLLTVYFHYQYHALATESRRAHLLAIAENQANTLDLFLRERLVNLTNVIEDPRLPPRPAAEAARDYLARLRRDSDTFVDLGFFDGAGTMLAYSGPYPSLLGRSYAGESWFVRLGEAENRYVITDLYLGFRQAPHFTIALRREVGGRPVVVRATLDPHRLSEHLAAHEGASEVQSAVVSATAQYQTVNLPGPLQGLGQPLVPSRSQRLGVDRLDGQRGVYDYAYCWLATTDWALLVLSAAPGAASWLGRVDVSLLALSVAVILAVLSATVVRASQLVRRRRQEDAAKRELSGQLQHAARLASVGELAAGVAHEINNPLAIIAEEAGVLRDLSSPEHGGTLEADELDDRLNAIQEAVFRARDITRKLLSFVRKTDVRLGRHDLNEIIEDAVGGLLEREMTVSNIRVVRELASDLPEVLADRNQLEQVVINLVTNAIDAMPNGGELKLRTQSGPGEVRLAVIDTGVGISPDQLEKVFMPFHTTKEVGKGTGLGLSVSYGIVRGYGGDLLVDSRVGEGSRFTMVIPTEPVGIDQPSEG